MERLHRDLAKLEGMTQAKWDRLLQSEKDALRSTAGLTKQLVGLEGWRVEVIDVYPDSKPRRFIVGRSTGWVPCHIELYNRRSRGGMGACREYQSVRKIERVRP